MKSVLISIQSYWVFLIIARFMGWNIPQEKTVEVRKDYPKASDWNKVTHIYCSKNRKSFNRIPKDYQPFIEKFLGCVIGEFVCDKIEKYCGRLTTYAETPYKNKYVSPEELAKTCLSIYELNDYLNGKNSYFWQISDLKIYDKPKELGEFVNCNKDCKSCEDRWLSNSYAIPTYVCLRGKYMTRPPQSWGYCNSL